MDTEGGGHIMIMAAAGGGANGNIAVDDVTLKFGACGESLTGVDMMQRALKVVHDYQKTILTSLCCYIYYIFGLTQMR